MSACLNLIMILTDLLKAVLVKIFKTKNVQNSHELFGYAALEENEC